MVATAALTEPQSTQQHWAVCQIFSPRGRFVREEIERSEHGTFVPTFVLSRYVAGKEFTREHPLLPGYLFFLTGPDAWSSVGEIEGVFRVLSNAGRASRVTDDEMRRLLVDHATGEHNRIETRLPTVGRYSKRRRRPRPGKRLRGASHARA